MKSLVGCLFALSCTVAVASVARAQTGTCEYPRVLIVLDKSSSMNNPLPSGGSLWNAARTAVTTTVTAFQNRVHFGLMVFPDPNQCSPGAVKVNIGANTASSMSSYLATPPPAGGNWTPMQQSVDAAGNYGPLLMGPQRNFVLLITDGWQWCDPYVPATRTAPIDAVRRLRGKGIKTFVVGFGGSVDVSTLNKMAFEGGTSPAGCNSNGTDPGAADRCYFQANSQTELSNALTQIARTTSAETCDGQDNDCDGFKDNAVTGNAAPLTKTCSSACGGGTSSCTNGVWSACNAPTPVAETCDGQDNDCDGFVDNAVRGNRAPMTRACSSACGAGVERCEAGQWVGCSAPPPVAETCDGQDNDCDGIADNAVRGNSAPLTRPCSSACGSGVESCRNGQWLECSAPPVVAEVCGDNVDNNCDGRVDEGCECGAGETRACGSSTGECRPGTQSCTQDGRWGDCQGGVMPATELCNGLDENCNGELDDGAQCEGDATCACGGCANPCRNNECPQGSVCTGGYCVFDRCPDGTHCEWTKCVPGPRPARDGGVDAGVRRDAGVMDAGTPDAGETEGPGGVQGPPSGCNCSTTVAQTPGLSAWLFGAALLALWWRRRTKRAV